MSLKTLDGLSGLQEAAAVAGRGIRTKDQIGSPMVQKQKTEHAFMVNLSRLAIGMDPLSKHIDDSDALSLDHEAMTGAMRVRAGSKNFVFRYPRSQRI
jgi:hypothetical protein